MPATTPKQKPFPQDDDAKPKEKANGYARPTFVRCDLDTAGKNELAQWANESNADHLLDCIVQSTLKGYTLSVKEAEVGYQASITQSKPASIGVSNAGKCLVTRASSPERALWALYYKHTRVLEEDWGKASQEANLEW